MNQKTVLVYGAGSWGTALAKQLTMSGHRVFLYSWNSVHNKEMLKFRNNEFYLKNSKFSNLLHFTVDFKKVIKYCSDIVIATPSMGFCTTLLLLKPYVSTHGIIIAAKGLCSKPNYLFHKIVNKVLKKNPLAIITGPSFSREVIAGLRTDIIVASNNIYYAIYVKELFDSYFFHCHVTNDIIGAQIGAVIKNILAIGCGIYRALRLGSNAISVLIIDGFKEGVNLVSFLGGQAETFYGLSGMGDIFLTCNDTCSRNYQFGFLLGKGKTSQQSCMIINRVIEGAVSVKSLAELSTQYGLFMPIIRAIYEITYHNKLIKNSIKKLLSMY